MNQIIKEYFDEFGEFPPLIMTTTYEDEIYQKLMKKAIERVERITDDELNEAFKNVKYDDVETSKIKLKEQKKNDN